MIIDEVREYVCYEDMGIMAEIKCDNYAIVIEIAEGFFSLYLDKAYHDFEGSGSIETELIQFIRGIGCHSSDRKLFKKAFIEIFYNHAYHHAYQKLKRDEEEYDEEEYDEGEINDADRENKQNVFDEKKFEEDLDKCLRLLSEKIDEAFDKLKAIESLEDEICALENRIGSLEKEIRALQERINSLEDRDIDRYIHR